MFTIALNIYHLMQHVRTFRSCCAVLCCAVLLSFSCKRPRRAHHEAERICACETADVPDERDASVGLLVVGACVRACVSARLPGGGGAEIECGKCMNSSSSRLQQLRESEESVSIPLAVLEWSAMIRLARQAGT